MRWRVIAGLFEHGCLPTSTPIGLAYESRKRAMAYAEHIKGGFWWIDKPGAEARWYSPAYIFVLPEKA